MRKEKLSRLRIHTTEEAQHDGHCLFEVIMKKTRENRMAGITITRGISGFGHKGHMHASRLVELSGNLPVIIDIIDTEEKILGFAALIVPWVKEGIVTIEEVTLLSSE